MNKITTIEFDRLVSQYSIDIDLLKERSAIKQIQKNWSDIIGPIYYNNTYPESIKNGKLIISVANSSYSMDVNFLCKSIIEQVNRLILFSGLQINKLVTKIGKISIKNNLPKKKIEPENLKEIPTDYKELLSKETDPEAQKKLLELIQLII